MGTPTDRRIIWGVHVIPQESFSTTSTEEEREEGTTVGVASYTDYKLDTTIGKRFGGKGSVAITEDQGDDAWVSFLHPTDGTWDSRSKADDKWEDTGAVWDLGGLLVNQDLSTLRTGSTVVKFLYIKNLGAVECELALEASGGSDERDILIPPGAAVSIRTHSSVNTGTLKVATAASSGTTTQIEYVIAI